MSENVNRLSPRQKMINLMYIVLTAMLALNVSSDVLDGFTQVHEGLTRSNDNVSSRNGAIYGQLEAFAAQNPEKGRVWLDRATEVRRETARMYRLVDSFKMEIVRKADGPEGDPDNIVSRDDLEAAAVVMLSPGKREGERLRHSIENYRSFVTGFVPDSTKRKSIESALSTMPVRRAGQLAPQAWEDAKFDQQPVVAAVTLLSKLQNDILYAEGEALTHLLGQVDAGDVRVNELNAFVIPQSRLVMRGGEYQASIVLAAIDTTQRPSVFVNGNRLPGDKGLYTVHTGTTGTFTYRGYIQLPHDDGTVSKYDFSSEYTVIEPMATVSATMMNVLYAGIDNPVSISVPGVPMNAISATMTNGTLTRNGDHWVARPAAIGKEAVVSVTATMDGRPVNVATTTFRVRKLPDPTAYIAYNDGKGNIDHYKGGKPFSKALLMAAQGLDAAIDDGLLDTKFTVISFETIIFDSMGNAMPYVSDGSRFSAQQRQAFQRLTRGKRFFISRIRAKGPDGTTRDLSPMEVIIG
ncbi:MAG: gliding motility protein GldM [Bacteroidales bacterium]|nr:gliding motility protein GldM [Bacteroidales bacterium]